MSDLDGIISFRPRRTTEEPHGHRGHPSCNEEVRARALAGRLGATIVVLKHHGFSEGEAISFIATTATEVSAETGETWSSITATKHTLNGLLAGRAAKHWSLEAIERALSTVAELLRPTPTREVA